MIGASEILLILFFPVFIFTIVFWFWMLVDCLKRPDDKFRIGGNNARLIWILVIIFTGLIGALIYYFLVKRTGSSQDRVIDVAFLASVFIIIILIASQFMATTKTTVSIEPYPSKLPPTTPTQVIVSVPSPVNHTPAASVASVPFIISIQPDSGFVGSKSVITGSGFTARDNNLAFRLATEDSNRTFKTGYINDLISRDGKTIEFTFPKWLSACAFPLPENTACPDIALSVTPGNYPVYIVNQNGTSNSVSFTVS